MNRRTIAADALVASALAFVAFDWFFIPPLHEFTIGDQSAQQQHEREMAGGNMMGMAHDADFSIDVPAGQTARLIYTFQQPGTLLFGCHVPGHYPAGMRGTITVTQG